ncbi:hypothetical protein D3C79_627510 [compost metagenome]
MSVHDDIFDNSHKTNGETGIRLLDPAVLKKAPGDAVTPFSVGDEDSIVNMDNPRNTF